MEYMAARQGDIRIPGEPVARALFPGQVYELPEEVAAEHDWLEPVEAPRARRRGKRDESGEDS